MVLSKLLARRLRALRRAVLPRVCVLPPATRLTTHLAPLLVTLIRTLLAMLQAALLARMWAIPPNLLLTKTLVTALVQLLVERGADVHQANQSGYTSLCIAAHQGHLPVVQLLM